MQGLENHTLYRLHSFFSTLPSISTPPTPNTHNMEPTFIGGGEGEGESDSSDTELSLGLLLRPLLFSREGGGGGEGTAREWRLLASPFSLPRTPSGDTLFLDVGFGLETRACFTGFGSGLKLSERRCFPGTLGLLVVMGGGEETGLSRFELLLLSCLVRCGGGEGERCGEEDFRLRCDFLFGSGDGE